MITQWLMKMFGAQLPPASRVSDAVLIFRRSNSIGLAFLALLLLAALTVWSYRRTSEQIHSATKYVMAGLRIMVIAMLLLLLLQPTLRLTVDGSIRRSIPLLLDATTSMKIEDARVDDADMKRAALAFGKMDLSKGLTQKFDRGILAGNDHPSRNAMVQAVLKNPALNLTASLGKDCDVRIATFGEKLMDVFPAVGWVDRLAPSSPVTPIGDALRETLTRSRGQPVAGIVLATDGQNNSGGAPLAVAEMAKAEGVPLYIYGVGLSDPKDIVVYNVLAQEIAFVDDHIPITVRCRGVGVEGETGHLVLKIGAEKIDAKDVQFDGSEQVVSMLYTPKKAGEFDLSASIEPRADEAVKDNNIASAHVKVIDGKIKVLLADSSPRWDFKYLQAMLLRDRRVDLKCVLTEADPAIADYVNSPYLKQFPKTKAELIDHFDLVILGDVESKMFSVEQMSAIEEFVGKFGGGMLSVPGKRYGSLVYRNSPIEKMLPVQLRSPSRTEAVASEKPISLQLTPAGSRSTMLRLAEDEASSKAVWAKLPAIYWEDLVGDSKPAAEVLLADAGTKMPILAVQQYGLGQSMYLGTDNTWRWRKNVGDKYYVTFWGQLIQRLALPHLLGESKRTQLTTDKKSYSTGERVTVFARLYDEGFSPINEASVRGSYTVEGHSSPVQLRALPDQPGMYRGEFIAPGEGNYSFAVDSDVKTKLDFVVAQPKLEMGETAMNEPLLREMARISGGAFFREEDLYKLPAMVSAKGETVRSNVEIDLWASPLVFAAIVFVAAVEWILRKWVRLK